MIMLPLRLSWSISIWYALALMVNLLKNSFMLGSFLARLTDGACWTGESVLSSSSWSLSGEEDREEEEESEEDMANWSGDR